MSYKISTAIDFLNENHGIEYKSVSKCSNQDEATHMLSLLNHSKEIKSIFNDMLESCAASTFLTGIPHHNILDGSCRKLRDYYWGQLRSADYFFYPESVSLFWEIVDGTAKFRVALDISEKHSDKYLMSIHNNIINFLPKGFDMFWGYKGHREVKQIFSIEEAKQLLSQNKGSKIMVGVYVEYCNRNDTEIIADTCNVIKRLIPLYEKVLSLME